MMHKNARDIAGMIFGKLTALHRLKNRSGKTAWLFACECGVKKQINSANVVSGKTSSCGCIKKGLQLTKIPEYSVWHSMVYRCTNIKSHAWDRYGGRGICVCDGWLEFSNFMKDMGFRPSAKHQLDRINNNGGYSKVNCRWALPKENVRNRSDSKYWFVDGVRYESMRQAARANNVAHSTIKTWCNNKINNCYSEGKYK